MTPQDSQYRQASKRADVRHLGSLVGGSNADRIIAVSTSAVFEDSSLPRTFWGVDDTAIDSGFQGHMYTRPNDILVVRVPSVDAGTPRMVTTALEVNGEIWTSFTGMRLLSAEGRVVLALDHPPQETVRFPVTQSWHVGSLLDAAATRYRATDESFLAFVLNMPVAETLGLPQQEDKALMDLARTTSQLMDKNVAMGILQETGIDCATTFPVNEDTDLDRVLKNMPVDGRYVFKPAGGAAGIGVFSNMGRGANRGEIAAHLVALRREGHLPRRFQMQQFVRGSTFGVTACFAEAPAFEILEIHQQFLSEAGRFLGGRWTAKFQAENIEFICMLCRQLAEIEPPRFSGLIGMDVIDRKLIEINPRLTASAPIAHLLARRDEIARHIGKGFRIEQIDLDTNIRVPYESIRDGSLRRLVEAVWIEREVIALPQGLNPFGNSRFVFINDDSEGTARSAFIQQIENPGRVRADLR